MPDPIFTYKGVSAYASILDDMQSIYDRCVDATSKQLFMNRLMYSITGEWSYIRNVVDLYSGATSFVKDLQEYQRVYIYGAGVRGKRLLNMYSEINWVGFIDKNKTGCIDGLKIFNPDDDQVINSTDAIVISNGYDELEIKKDLEQLGVDSQRIYIISDYNDKKNIYFDDSLPIYDGLGGYFIDVGPYDGNDSVHFLDRVNNDSGQVLAIEPDYQNYLVCQKRFSDMRGCKVLHMGLADSITKMGFNAGMGRASSFEMGDDAIDVVTLDELLGKRIPKMIKMDIEGMEMAALQGARQCISMYKPILAVSLYHKREDIIDIPKAILSFNEEYHFYIRHYSALSHDTVLYAV